MMMMICVCVQGPLGVWVWEWVGLNPYRPRWPILVNITDTHPIVLLYKPTFTRLHPQILSSDQKCSSFFGPTLFWSLSLWSLPVAECKVIEYWRGSLISQKMIRTEQKAWHRGNNEGWWWIAQEDSASSYCEIEISLATPESS